MHKEHTHHDSNMNIQHAHGPLTKCEVCHQSLAYCSCLNKEPEQVVYRVENLDCANCGAKIEKKLSELPAVNDCSLIFNLKQLRVSAPNQEILLPELIQITQSIEPDVVLIPEKKKTKSENLTYIVEGLDCPNCTKKLEDRINDLPNIETASVSLETGLIKLKTDDSKGLLQDLQQVADTLEEGLIIKPKPKEKIKVESESKKLNTELIQILIGSLIFVSSWFFEARIGFIPEVILQGIAYLLLGSRVLKTAFKNLFNGNIFDENFLMSIATLAAFAIGDFHEGVGIMLFYRVGEYFEEYAVERSRKQIMSAVDLRPETVNLLINEEIVNIPAEQAQVGDILMIRPGDRIPLDGIILEGSSRIDTSAVTGEPVPVSVKPGDEVISGTVNENGQLKIEVKNELQESMVTKILESVENAAANKPKVDRFITKFSRIYTPIVVGLALLIALVPPLFTGNWYYWIYTAVSLLVISCPCALVLSVPLAYFCGIGAASKLGILFKGGSSIEVLTKIKGIIFDKTGTITEGKFSVQEIKPNQISKDELLEIATKCELNSTHPIAQSIVATYEEQHPAIKGFDQIEEIAGKGIVAKNGTQTFFVGNSKLLKDNQIDLSEYSPSDYGTEVLVASNDGYFGSIVISDSIKADAIESIDFINKNNIETVMLTGDSKNNAKAVAEKSGIKRFFAELLPVQKLSQLQSIREDVGPVMFVGDGINDAPVLAGADVGAAMGSGTDAAIEASDVVFMNSNLSAIKKAYQIGKKTYNIAWQNIVFALVVKAFIIFLGLIGFANMWLAVFADTGVSILCILNSIRILRIK